MVSGFSSWSPGATRCFRKGRLQSEGRGLCPSAGSQYGFPKPLSSARQDSGSGSSFHFGWI